MRRVILAEALAGTGFQNEGFCGYDASSLVHSPDVWLTKEATLPTALETERAPAWELVETGRYRPLRTRGSFPGRELG